MVVELAPDGRIRKVSPHLRPWLALFALVLGPKVARHPTPPSAAPWPSAPDFELAIARQGREGDNSGVSFSLLRASEAFWRPSNQMKVENTDLGKQLEASKLGARLWRLAPGQASTRHRHFEQEEFYVLLEGEGRVRVDGELLTLAPLDTLLVTPDSSRQLFNDTEADQLWLVVGAPPELANTLEMSEDQLAHVYPDGPKALPPELE